MQFIDYTNLFLIFLGILFLFFNKKFSSLEQWFRDNPMYKGKKVTLLWGHAPIWITGKHAPLVYKIVGAALIVIGITFLTILHYPFN